MMQLDKNLIERIQRLMDLGKIRQDVKVTDISEHVDTYMDGKFFFGRILQEEPSEEMLRTSFLFMQTYSRSIQVA
ncbi:MAG: hypothetical protein H7256_02070 [Bdellovibrio sp.]|nr:hypothetical protein [Bdellovibrio sp.]